MLRCYPNSRRTKLQVWSSINIVINEAEYEPDGQPFSTIHYDNISRSRNYMASCKSEKLQRVTAP